MNINLYFLQVEENKYLLLNWKYTYSPFNEQLLIFFNILNIIPQITYKYNFGFILIFNIRTFL